jgi:hypothetical protein
MAIIFKEKLKTQQFLVFLLFVFIIVAIFFIGQRLVIKKILPEEVVVPQPIGKIEIDFETLKSPLLENLQPIEKIIPLETGIGRENPFLPY